MIIRVMTTAATATTTRTDSLLREVKSVMDVAIVVFSISNNSTPKERLGMSVSVLNSMVVKAVIPPVSVPMTTRFLIKTRTTTSTTRRRTMITTNRTARRPNRSFVPWIWAPFFPSLIRAILLTLVGSSNDGSKFKWEKIPWAMPNTCVVFPKTNAAAGP